MKPRHRRFIFVALALVGVGIAMVLVTNALQSNIAYFFSPTQILAGEAPQKRLFRVGGLVKKDSVKHTGEGLTVEFVVTDTVKEIKVQYTGILPDLFKEEKSVIAKGKLQQDGIFVAEEVLAKHDENYMPPEVAESLSAAQKQKFKQASEK